MHRIAIWSKENYDEMGEDPNMSQKALLGRRTREREEIDPV
jgi:hypothetical protein